MKAKLIFLAAIALTVACNKENPSAAPEATVLRFKAGVPASTETKITSEQDGTGLKFAWEEDDVICLNFIYNGNSYPIDAAIDATTISTDGTNAEFTVTLPEAIPADASFDVYAIYQKAQTWAPAQNRKWYDEDSFRFVTTETYGVALVSSFEDNPGKTSNIIRPALYGEQKGVTASSLESFTLEHLGWVACLHFRNKTASTIDVPRSLTIRSTDYYSQLFKNSDEFFQIGSGINNTSHEIHFALANDQSREYYGKSLAAGEEGVYYRWTTSVESLPELIGRMNISDTETVTSTNSLSARTVTPGKMYHFYLNWDGTDLTFGK